MKYQLNKAEKYSLIKIDEENLNSLIAPELKSIFLVESDSGVKSFIIDMSSIKFCDSSGLSALLIGSRLSRDSGGSFILSGMQPMVEKVFMISQLDKVVSHVPKVEEAVDLVFMEEIERDLGEIE